ncbi:MAG: hypothetical protein J6N78_05230 [Clostridia bacterium]|nr:hypothetical protein [Clostridia bacterium]
MEQQNKKINALLNIPYSSKEEFYEWWVTFLKPIHKMSSVPCKVFAVILAEREKYAKTNDSNNVDTILFSPEAQEIICEKLNIDKIKFWCHLSVLRKYGVINKNKVNPKFIPEITDDNMFRLMLKFYKKNDSKFK